MKQSIGLHVRLQQNLSDVVTFVEQMKLSLVQSFLINEQGSYVSCNPNVIKKFVKAKKDLGFSYFVHAAYWSNLTDIKSKEFASLCKEALIASDLESQGIVIHVGATKTKVNKADQIKYVLEGINTLLLKAPDVDIFLENSPHAGRNFGGDITDFATLTNGIEQKNRVKFCIDTAHAFVYGYNLIDTYNRKNFFKLLEEVFPKDSIGLLHLNDTDQDCASKIDKHDILGQGKLGETVLRDCMQMSLFKDVPIILELPASCDQKESIRVLNKAISWA